MDRVALRRLWRRGQHGWPPGFPIAQFPNLPLLVAFAAALVSALSDGAVHATARGVFYLGLGIWAYLELADGANWVRRLVGAGGLLFVVARLAQAFGA